MGDAMQEPRQSVFLLLVVRGLGLARARAVGNIPGAANPRRFEPVRVRRMRVVSAMRFHGGFDVRYLARGEIRQPSAACGVPV